MKPVDSGVVPPGLVRHQNNIVPQTEEESTPEPQAGGGDGGVDVVLSVEAQELLNFEAGAFGPPHSTAAQARFAVTQTEGLEGLPFGKVVSALARGIDPSTLIAQPQDPVEPGAGEKAPVIDPLTVSAEETEKGAEFPAAELILAAEETPSTISGADLALALLTQDEETAI